MVILRRYGLSVENPDNVVKQDNVENPNNLKNQDNVVNQTRPEKDSKDGDDGEDEDDIFRDIYDSIPSQRSGPGYERGEEADSDDTRLLTERWRRTSARTETVKSTPWM